MLIPKVLLVNDNAASLTALESILAEPAGRGEYEVVTALSGESALREVLHSDFAVIVLDVRMPIMDGFDTAEAIHSHPRSADVPIIFITAHMADEMNRLKGYLKGAVDYLLTPIIPQILQTKVSVFVELKKRNLQLRQQSAELALLNQDLRIQRLRDLERLNAELAAEVVERKKAEHREHELATRDPLTGLLNRRSLLDALERSVVNAARRKEQFALLFLDLDKFKTINDTLGHGVGDDLLRQVALRLSKAVRESDVVARLGGDEFVVQIQALASSTMAAQVAKKIALSLARPYQIDTHEVTTSASIGIGLYPRDDTSIHGLMGKADKAMYHAKQNKRGSIQFFHAELNARELERNHFKEELTQALCNNEFDLYFQPRMEIVSMRMVAIQTVLHWRHPRLGLITAAQFMPQAGACGLLGEIGQWLAIAASAQARQWQESHSTLHQVPLAIDAELPFVSPELPRMVLTALRRQKLAPSCLELGFAESLLVRDADKTVEVLKEFRQAGVGLAIACLGTAPLPLALLKKLSPDVLKIDQRLVHAFDSDGGDTVPISSVVCAARTLDIRVVAQGVDTPSQLVKLEALGCHEFQGDFYCPPLKAAALQQWWEQSAVSSVA